MRKGLWFWAILGILGTATIVCSQPREKEEVKKLKQMQEDIQILRVLNPLELKFGQIKTIVQILERIEAAKRGMAEEETRSLTAMRRTYEQALETLMEGKPLPASTASHIDAEAQRVKEKKRLYQNQIQALLGEIKRLLTPEQLAKTEIGLRGGLPRAESPEVTRARGLLLQFVNTVRYMERRDYLFRRSRLAQQFVVEFFGLPVTDPRFNAYGQMVLDLMDRVRMLPEEQFDKQKQEIINNFLVQVGYIQPTPEKKEEKPQQLISEEQLDEVFLNPRTLELLKLRLKEMGVQ